MNEEVLQTELLCKKYGNNYALKDCFIHIQKGQIYGLVGKNGAGKTTLMRLICGQSEATSGKMNLFGSESEEDLINARKRLGCVIETPSFYPYFSAKKNLQIYAMKKGIPSDKQINELLKLVGLENAHNKPFKDFSLGMKERLGIALALLGNPEFLVLDEPTNGLDPIGVAEIRKLILKLNKEKNVTILISSHILKELSMIATHYGFIEDGRLVKEVSQKELDKMCQSYISFEVDNTKQASIVLEQICGIKDYIVKENNVIDVFEEIEHPEHINREFVSNNVNVYAISKKGKDLEEFFINLLKEDDSNV